MDRINPRLFDVMVVIGILFVLPALRRSVRLPREFYYWAWIVTIFVFCALIYAAFLIPFEYGMYSLFFAGKYIEGLLAIYIALKIPLSQEQKKKVMQAIAIGGIYVAAYCIHQYFTASSSGEIEIAPGKFVKYYGLILTGPLSYNYLQIAQFSSLSAIVTLSLIETARGVARRGGVVALASFIAWPLFFSGSRAGLGLLIISMAVGFLLLRGVKSHFLVLVLALGVFLIFIPSPFNLETLNEPRTFSRLADAGGEHNSIVNRLTLALRFDPDDYSWATVLPLIGGGFYVAPKLHGTTEVYRIGYGVHNSYLFPLEQGGLFALLAFLLFLAVIIRKLNWMKNSRVLSDRALAIAVLSYMLASLPA
jgi:hypothetical protein